jgi:peptidoglycan/xylan/chitin deacetylase (PgdA/CDA1 family)
VSGPRTLRDTLALTARRAHAAASTALGIATRRIEARRGEVAVLMYHRVLPDDAPVDGVEPGMYVRAGNFARQLLFLKRRFEVRTLGSLMRNPPSPSHPPAVAITFDDGWRDNLTVAWPILSQLGLRATIFLVGQWVAQGRNPEGEFLEPRDVAALHAEGMEFGAHTITHPRLTTLSDAEVRDEMVRSRQAVEDWTSAACSAFAYPYGDLDARVAAHARSTFQSAVVVGGGWWAPGGDPVLVPRVGIHQDMTSTRAMFQMRLAG